MISYAAMTDAEKKAYMEKSIKERDAKEKDFKANKSKRSAEAINLVSSKGYGLKVASLAGFNSK